MIPFFKKIIGVLEEEDIAYMVSGSLAYGLYATPRMSRDFDFIVHLKEEDVKKFVSHFSKNYYCDIDSINDAIVRKSIFNVIDFASSYKADFIILKNESFRTNEFERRIRKEIFGIQVWAVTLEDLVIAKFLWIQDLQSGVQIDDITYLLKNKEIDLSYIKNWVEKLNINTFNLI